MNFHIAKTKWSVKPHAVLFFGKKGAPETGKPYAPVTRCGRVATEIIRKKFDTTDTEACGRCVLSVGKAERVAKAKAKVRSIQRAEQAAETK